MSEKHLPGVGGMFDRVVFDGDDTVWVPERTCTNTKMDGSYFMCSRCHAAFDMLDWEVEQ